MRIKRFTFILLISIILLVLYLSMSIFFVFERRSVVDETQESFVQGAAIGRDKLEHGHEEFNAVQEGFRESLVKNEVSMTETTQYGMSVVRDQKENLPPSSPPNTLSAVANGADLNSPPPSENQSAAPAHKQNEEAKNRPPPPLSSPPAAHTLRGVPKAPPSIEDHHTISFSPSTQSMCSTPGSHPIFSSLFLTQYRHNKRAAISLTFDDGQLPQFAYIAPTLEKYNMRGTFFICPVFTGKIPWREIDESQQPSVVRKSVWDSYTIHPLWRAHALPVVKKAFHEFASHSSYHKNFGKPITQPQWYNPSDDFQDSIAFIKDIFEYPDEVVTFAWPFGASEQSNREHAMKHFIAARGINCAINRPSNMQYKALNACNFELMTTETMLKEVFQAIHFGGYLVEFMHSILSCGKLKFGESCPKGFGNVDPVAFEQHLEDITSLRDHLWIDSFGNVTKYLREREATEIVHAQWIHDSGRDQYSLRVILRSDYHAAMKGLVKQPVKLTLAMRLDSSMHVGSNEDTDDVPRSVWPFSINRIMNSHVTEQGETLQYHQEHDYWLRRRHDVPALDILEKQAPTSSAKKGVESEVGGDVQTSPEEQPPQGPHTNRNVFLVDFLPQRDQLTVLDIVFDKPPCT